MKRPWAEMEEVKRPNSSTTGPEAAAAQADREHTMLVRLFELKQAPAEKLNLANIGNYLEKAVETKGLDEGLQFIAKGWRRSEEGGVVPSTWSGIAPLQEAIQTVALSTILAASSSEKVRVTLSLLQTMVPPRLMNELLAAVAEDPEVPPRILLDLAKPLKGRLINELRSGHLSKLVRVLRSSKRYIDALFAPPCTEELWCSTFEPKFAFRNRKMEVIGKQRPGFALQSDSLLGWVLSPSALDGGLAPPSLAHLTEPGGPEWSDVRRATQSKIHMLQKGTQMKVKGVQDQAAELIDILVRAGDGPRNRVLTWLGTLLTAAEPRGKQGYIAPDGFNFWPQGGHHIIDVLGQAETPPFQRSLKNLLMLQAIHARIYGFPTSGCSLNAFALLLHLCKPIKQDQAASLSVYFTLREDVPDLLGAWQKEARFGEKEQIEAATEVGKKDAGFSTPAMDKSLFKTQVFWLASKGVGTLMLPVAKEAFNAFQGVASVFYHKDPGLSDTAWREFCLAEATLKEPAFLDNLGHFVNLNFRFLQHVAAGGKQALPPPAPGPDWHALPSTVLENILDICDLYRDRGGKGGQIPQGLFAMLDPDPILTLLCIVMASDDHVRDPSLRGRAVKLMHRLCTAFHTWGERLNQQPLRDNLIPCLVGVFIGVEKAIMSYYDLAYRYKYELRVPVMDLFELALQNEYHRKVLVDFVHGAGKERFVKLLTQLINDSNSQIEEAINTLRDYRKEKKEAEANPAAAVAPPSAPSGGGSHDEEVLADDQTAEGEDVYRRSRMNYKEHAKKYFAMASKTWNQLWLLCKNCAPAIVEKPTILEQLLHSSLDAQLHNLVGPEMVNIKFTPMEYEDLNFNAKELVRQIAEIYLFLVRVNRDEVCRIVAKDERYYSPRTFGKAVNFARKYGCLTGENLEEFDKWVKELEAKVSDQRVAFGEANIPERFLCEMMADIMSDPVMFPQSKKILDRCNAERQIMSADRDPYANTPVKIEDLIPQAELKEEIHRFAKEKGIALEGGNMFD